MKLSTKSRWLLAIGFFWFMGTTTWLIYERYVPIDYSKEEEPFCSMVMPIRSASGDYWMDGGSVSVRIVDKNGHEHDLAFIYDHSKPEAPYTRAFHGTWDLNELRIKGIAIKDPERARVLAIRLLSDCADPSGDSARGALNSLKYGGRSLPQHLVEKTKSLFTH